MYRVRAILIALSCFLAGSADAQTDTARQLWERGQEAMRADQPERAIGFYEECLRVDPSFSHAHLSMAAALTARGDETAACLQLSRYLSANPQHHLIRTHFAELLLRIGRLELAKLELRRFLLDTEDGDEMYAPEWVHCHQRLADIAAIEENAYEVRVHRGIALYFMAQQLAAQADDGEVNVEGLLFKAAAELSAAHALAPESARTCWYLHLSWAGLGQSQTARRYLNETREQLLLSDLSPGEQRAASMSCRSEPRP